MQTQSRAWLPVSGVIQGLYVVIQVGASDTRGYGHEGGIGHDGFKILGRLGLQPLTTMPDAVFRRDDLGSGSINILEIPAAASADYRTCL